MGQWSSTLVMLTKLSLLAVLRGPATVTVVRFTLDPPDYQPIQCVNQDLQATSLNIRHSNATVLQSAF